VTGYVSIPDNEKKKIYMNSAFRGFISHLCHCRNKILNVASYCVVHRIPRFLDFEDIIRFNGKPGDITSLVPI
jgi:hypothetical protein